jgi:hypothetical protein
MCSVLLCRRGAAEVRKQVSSAYLSDLPTSISGLNLANVSDNTCIYVNIVYLAQKHFIHQNSV